MNHLCGEGECAEPRLQANVLAVPTLDLIQGAAERAFHQIPSHGFHASFAAVRQQLNKPFIDFINRLKVQVERRVEDPDSHVVILLEMAKANGNKDCQQIIRGMPLDPPPS